MEKTPKIAKNIKKEKKTAERIKESTDSKDSNKHESRFNQLLDDAVLGVKKTAK